MSFGFWKLRKLPRVAPAAGVVLPVAVEVRHRTGAHGWQDTDARPRYSTRRNSTPLRSPRTSTMTRPRPPPGISQRGTTSCSSAPSWCRFGQMPSATLLPLDGVEVSRPRESSTTGRCARSPGNVEVMAAVIRAGGADRSAGQRIPVWGTRRNLRDRSVGHRIRSVWRKRRALRHSTGPICRRR
jgi:hypothetical protein